MIFNFLDNMKLEFYNFIETIKLQILSFIPAFVLEFIKKREHQDSLLFASIASLTIKIIYFFIIDVQLKGLALIVIFLYVYLFNYFADFYLFYIRERFYKFLTKGMGEKALFSGRFKDVPWIDTASEHLGHIIFRNILFILVRIRLLVSAEPFSFLILRFFLIYFLLFNHFLLTTYFLSFLLIASRMVFYITDFTDKDVQRSMNIINNYNQNKSDNTFEYIVLKPSLKNSQILTFWLFRCEISDLDNDDSYTYTDSEERRDMYLKFYEEEFLDGILYTISQPSRIYSHFYNLGLTNIEVTSVSHIDENTRRPFVFLSRYDKNQYFPLVILLIFLYALFII